MTIVRFLMGVMMEAVTQETAALPIAKLVIQAAPQKKLI